MILADVRGYHVERRRHVGEALLLWMEQAALHDTASRGAFWTRTEDEARSVIDLCYLVLDRQGGRYDKMRQRWRMPNGATLLIASYPWDDLVAGFGGDVWTMLVVVDAPRWTNDRILNVLLSCVRNPDGVPSRVITTGEAG